MPQIRSLLPWGAAAVAAALTELSNRSRLLSRPVLWRARGILPRPERKLRLQLSAGRPQVYREPPQAPARRPTLAGRPRWLCFLAGVALAACEQATDFVRPPGRDTLNDGSQGEVQRASFSVEVTMAPEDTAVARALQWPRGAVPGAEVTLRRMGETSTQSALTDSSGTVRFARLLPGTYSVSIFRLLNDNERERLRATDKSLDDVNALGGASFHDVTPPRDSALVSVVAGRRGSLVISEVFHYKDYSVGDFGYKDGHYVEFYKNSDSVIFMDGKLMARPYWFPWESRDYPCSLTDPWRLDPRGIWSDQYVRFPGRGRDYPVRPGQAVLVVMDAIDHRAFSPRMQELSRADFEYVGGADVDNPDVPNLIDAGPRKWVNPLGKGFYIQTGKDGILLAEGFGPGEPIVDYVPDPRVTEHPLIVALLNHL